MRQTWLYGKLWRIWADSFSFSGESKWYTEPLGRILNFAVYHDFKRH